MGLLAAISVATVHLVGTLTDLRAVKVVALFRPAAAHRRVARAVTVHPVATDRRAATLGAIVRPAVISTDLPVAKEVVAMDLRVAAIPVDAHRTSRLAAPRDAMAVVHRSVANPVTVRSGLRARGRMTVEVIGPTVVRAAVLPVPMAVATGRTVPPVAARSCSASVPSSLGWYRV